MARDDLDEYKRKHRFDSDQDDAGSGTAGGQSGQIQFHDFLAGQRENNLSPLEEKHLIATHINVNEANIKKQKEKTEYYQAIKEGKYPANQYGQGYGQGETPPHPLLAEKFKGTDNNIKPLPSENRSDTNNENREELRNEYDLRFRPQNAPKFNPKPTPYK